MKSEIRRPKPDPLRRRDSAAGGNPKAEIRIGSTVFRISDFGLPSAFGFRPSDFLPLWLILSTALLPPSLPAQPAPGASFITRSSSGQFIIHASQPAGHSAPAVDPGARPGFVRLDAARLTYSSERIKQVLWRNLAATAPWRGKIHLYLHSTTGLDEPITITSEQFTDGWQYGIYLPDLVERERFARALVQVLLLEMANRNAQAHGAEVPLWLAEGLTQQLLSDAEAGLIPPPPRPGGKGLDQLDVARTVIEVRTNDPLAAARQNVRARQPLTFEQLSWPGEDSLDGPAGQVYRGSAQLFVAELSRLPDGRACLRALVEELPAYLNWQLAFLKAFQARFQTPLEVEKWWALQAVRFTDHDLTHTWSLEESWQKLDQTLRSTIQVRTGPSELPLRAEATLQTVIRELEAARQTQALSSKADELDFVRLRVTLELAPLAEEYRQTLLAYLQSQSKTLPVTPRGEKPGLSQAARETLQHLDALDARRELLRRALTPATTVQAQPPPTPSP